MTEETIISREDLKKLPEYSCSIPTGTTLGKRWRRMLHHGEPQETHPVEKREWKIGEYVKHPNPELMGIKWTWALDENHEPHKGKIN